MLQETVKGASGVPRFDIQMGESEATINTSYRTMEVIFPRRFATIPKVYVGEARGGSWVIVKVDEKHDDRFRWAGNNLVPKFPYTTVIQWIAIAEIGTPDAAPPAAAKPQQA